MAKKLKAEMWDKLHYLFREFNDRVIHVQLDYDFTVDVDIIKEFIVSLFEAAPILHSSFVDNRIRPYWVVNPYKPEDAITVKDIVAADKDKAVEAFLMQEVNYYDKIQFRFGIFNYDGKSSVCIVTNHMCMDGGGIKYLVNKFCSDYTYYVENGKMPGGIIDGTRSHTAVYRDLPEEDQKAAKRLFRNPSVRDRHKFPLTESRPNDKSFMPRHIIDRDTFLTLKTIGKAHGYTLNDILVGAYYESVYRLAGFDKSESLTIACAIDLRRYIADPESIGLTNHTAWMQCNIPHLGNDIFGTLKLAAESTNKFKQDKYMGLYGLPLLNFGYNAFPHFISEFAVKLGYSNPHIAMSNIGILVPKNLAICGKEPVYAFMSGAVKYKPFVLFSLISYRDEVTLAFGVRGNEDDRKIIEKFYSIYDECLKEIIDGWNNK